ncbi:phospholipid/cholesterol/gamma-HCH transport system substrate-binding protein [Gordonia amarae]|uniref:Mce family protein n=2 Tax=Gordonia amarae TaxID=36821 RepID=G7GKG3_9ACTN|nr:phospholipid/cholesterol/gamma-HCH transport system substrate-binding protein [Gordonia amarae]GAB04088.1 Mce family protein [Gordonia amarae NBRC 15530]
MSRKQERSTAVRRTAALIMVGGLTALIVGAAGQFVGMFDSTEQVTLHSPRAGLVMSPEAKVKLRGVTVGHVKSVSEHNGQAVLKLEMDADQMSSIPANVKAEIKSNTIFGAKAVNLSVPEDGAQGRLRRGQVIGADHVVVELNTVYQQLVNVLAELQPDKLNATLGAVDTALSGRGDKVGASLVQLTSLLGKTNKHLPELNRMFTEAATVTNVYADVTNDLMRTVDNFTVIGNTLVDNSANLDALLINATGMANTVNGVVAPSVNTLIRSLTDLNPVARLLGYQSPGIKCFITTAASAGELAKPYMGADKKSPYLKLDASIMPGKDPYEYPYDLPEVRGDGPPTCETGLSNPSSTEHMKFYVSDNANYPYQPRTKPKADSTKLFQLMFGEPPRG